MFVTLTTGSEHEAGSGRTGEGTGKPTATPLSRTDPRGRRKISRQPEQHYQTTCTPRTCSLHHTRTLTTEVGAHTDTWKRLSPIRGSSCLCWPSFLYEHPPYLCWGPTPCTWPLLCGCPLHPAGALTLCPSCLLCGHRLTQAESPCQAIPTRMHSGRVTNSAVLTHIRA